MSNANSRWVKVDAPEAWRTDDIWMHDESIGWAVNSNGQILRTDDGFKSKPVEQKHVQENYLRCVAFADDSVGWVSTTDKQRRAEQLFHTSDGGKNWTGVDNLPDDGPEKICGLWAVDRNTVFAAGTNLPDRKPAILKTPNGGQTWQAIDMSAVACLLVDIYFKDEKEGWVVGAEDDVTHPLLRTQRADVLPVVLHTLDGGTRWTNLLKPIRDDLPRGEWGWKIQVVDRKTMVVALENFTDGAYLRSDDFGQTWRRIRINDRQRNANLQAVGFVDKKEGWAGGWGTKDKTGGFSSATSDGGKTWDDANGILIGVNRFRFVGDAKRAGFAAGCGIYRYIEEAPDMSYPDGIASIQSNPDGRPGGGVPVIQGSATGVIVPFDVPEGTVSLRIRVWDVYGHSLGLLLEEANPRSGKREFRWDFKGDGDRQSSERNFIVRITTDDRSVSRGVLRHPAPIERPSAPGWALWLIDLLKQVIAQRSRGEKL